jgi:hypothetical protein
MEPVEMTYLRHDLETMRQDFRRTLLHTIADLQLGHGAATMTPPRVHVTVDRLERVIDKLQAQLAKL